MGLEMAVRDMERSDEEESDDEVQTLKGVWCWVSEDSIFIYSK